MPTEPQSWRDSFHAQITGNFKEDEGNEKDDKSDIELIADQMKVVLQALDTGIADIDAIDEREEPDEEERYNEADVTFSGQFADLFAIVNGGRLPDSGCEDLLAVNGGWGLTHFIAVQLSI